MDDAALTSLINDLFDSHLQAADRTDQLEPGFALPRITVSTEGTFGEPIDVSRSIASVSMLSGQFTSSCDVYLQGKIAEGVLEAAVASAVAGFEVVRSERIVRGQNQTRRVFGCGTHLGGAHHGEPVGVHYRHTVAGVSLLAVATTDRLARDVCRNILAELPAVEVSSSDDVTMTFVYGSSHGVASRDRQIGAPTWDDIAGNYSTGARQALASLMAMTQAPASGRLILFHGDPGTGKTTAIRALARAWAPWCATTFVIDPERLFSDPEYLQALLIDDDGGFDEEGAETAPSTKWRLIVLEDTDELITGDAKRRTGQALSRLLNLTDGLLGQGLNVLLLMTTNEPIHTLHPAAVRAGRCLADVEIGKLSVADARRWLTAHDAGRFVDKVAADASVAELYALIGSEVIVAGPEQDVSRPPGQYL